MPRLDFATLAKIVNSAGKDFGENILVFGKTKIRLPRWLTKDLSKDRARAEDVLRYCFIQRRAMYTSLDRQSYEYILKNLEEIAEALDRNRKDIPEKGSKLDKELRSILGRWLDRTVAIFKAMRDAGADDVSSDPGSLEACASLLADYRREVFPYVRVFMAVLGNKHPVSIEAKQRLDLASGQMPQANGRPRTGVAETMEPKVQVATG